MHTSDRSVTYDNGKRLNLASVSCMAAQVLKGDDGSRCVLGVLVTMSPVTSVGPKLEPAVSAEQ